MLIATINEKEYNIPNTWHDVTLGQYINYLNILSKTIPTELKQAYEGDKQPLLQLEESEYILKMLPFYARVVAALSNIPYEVLMQCTPNSLEQIYSGINTTLTEPKHDTRVKAFKLLGEYYYLPNRLMQGNKVEDFIEAAQLEQFFGKESAWHAMPKVCAVILRKKGEKYNDALLKRERIMLSLTMWQAFQVYFFLSRQNKVLANVSQIALNHLAQMQQEQEQTSLASLTAGI